MISLELLGENISLTQGYQMEENGYLFIFPKYSLKGSP